MDKPLSQLSNVHQVSLYDSHCHFDFSQFDDNREAVWNECCQQGITRLLIPGVSPHYWDRAAKLCEQYSGISMALGYHPYFLSHEDEGQQQHQQQQMKHLQFENVRQSLLQNQYLLDKEYCVAIGECGLDSLIPVSMEYQLSILEKHLILAQELNKPIILHVRKAHNELQQLLSKFDLPAGGVIHGFSGSYELAMAYWRKGFYLGIGGTISYERANKTRSAVTRLPLEAIVLETDAPDMPLSGYQGQDNSPIKLLNIAKILASLRGESLSVVATKTTYNCYSLFHAK